MSMFLNRLCLDAADDSDNGAWIFKEDLCYRSEHMAKLKLAAFPDGLVTVPAGFQTDFASVPRLPVVYLLVGGRARYASCVHDFLYSKSGVSRRDADAVFYEAACLGGGSKPLSWLMWLGVRLGGSGHYTAAT
jgi:hypothetical protein